MPLPSAQKLVRLSRDRNALLKTSFILVTVSLGIAFAVSFLFPVTRLFADLQNPSPPSTVSELISRIRFDSVQKEGSCVDLITDARERLFLEEIEASLEDFASDPASPLLRLWWEGLKAEDPAEAIRRLDAMDPNARYFHEFFGDLQSKTGNTESALRAYLAEAERFAEADYARRSALLLARYEEYIPLLKRLLKDESFRAATSPADWLDYQTGARDYFGMARSLLLVEWELLRSAFLLPALFTAAIWFFILLSFRSSDRTFLGLSFVAFLLGVASAVLTVYAVMIQENIRGFRSGPEAPAAEQFIYLLAGVSLREEFLKLLCFAPVAIASRKRGTALEALVLAGMVGLGFAFQENLAYFRTETGTFTAWLRLLTANALHFSLTGVAGLALWRMVARRFRGWEECLVTFFIVVFAHALYNALLSMPMLAEYAPLAPLLVAVIAYGFFDPLRQHLDIAGLHRRLSPLGIFVIGSVLLTCAILVSSAAFMPFRFAVGLFASSVASLIPLAFAFIGRFRDL